MLLAIWSDACSNFPTSFPSASAGHSVVLLMLHFDQGNPGHPMSFGWACTLVPRAAGGAEADCSGHCRLSKSLDSMWVLFFMMGLIWFPVFIVICRGSKHSQSRRGATTLGHMPLHRPVRMLNTKNSNATTNDLSPTLPHTGPVSFVLALAWRNAELLRIRQLSYRVQVFGLV